MSIYIITLKMTGRKLFDIPISEILKYFRDFDPEREYFWYKTGSINVPFYIHGMQVIPERLKKFPTIEKKVPTFSMKDYRQADGFADFRVEISSPKRGKIRIEWRSGGIINVEKIIC